MEINLLKKLQHPHIVKYVDQVRTDEYLHIMLEWVPATAPSPSRC